MTTPPRPDQEIAPPPAVLAPGGASGIFRGRLIIVNGQTPPAGGIFLYDSTGSLVGYWVSIAGTDPLDGSSINPGFQVQDSTAARQFANIEAGIILLQKNAGLLVPPNITVQDTTTNFTTELSTTLLTFSNASNTVSLQASGSYNFVETSDSNGTAYAVAHRIQLATGAQTINNATAAGLTVTGLSFNVIPTTYRVVGFVKGTNGSNVAEQAFGVNGTATATAVEINETFYSATNNTFKGYGLVESLGARASVTSNLAASEVFTCLFEGFITVSVAGTLTITASCVTSASDTWTVNAGEIMIAPAA